MNECSAAGPSDVGAAGAELGILVAAAPASSRPSIEDQRDEVAREVRQRERLYPDWIAKGRYKPETAEKKLRDIRAAHASLEFLAKHAEGLRLLIKVLQRVEKFGPSGDNGEPISGSEAADLLRQPAVRAVLNAFPNARLEIRHIESEFCDQGENSDSEDA